MRQKKVPGPLLDLRIDLRVFGELDSYPVRQHLDRLTKIFFLDFHDEAKHVAADAASKTMKNLLVRADHKRGCLFPVKRTIALKISAGLAQRQITGNHFHDVQAILDLVDRRVGNHGAVLFFFRQPKLR